MRSLPDTADDDMYCPPVAFEDEDAASDNSEAVSEYEVSVVSGIIFRTHSNSRTTSNTDGLFSGLSSQHRRANVTNFSMHSDGYEPILLSIMENIMLDWWDIFTFKIIYPLITDRSTYKGRIGFSLMNSMNLILFPTFTTSFQRAGLKNRTKTKPSSDSSCVFFS